MGSMSGIEKLRAEAKKIRLDMRSGAYDGQTSGMTPGLAQANLAIMPKEYAGDFLRFCNSNRKPCPILGVSGVGDPMLPMCGDDIDIRTDVSRYWLYENGEPVGEVTDLNEHWRDDLVTFAVGCSYSFEEALINAEIPIRNIEMGVTVSMWDTNIQCEGAGPFETPMVVSMRPMTPAQAIRAIQICSRFPDVHGAPIHFGDPAAIGIKDITKPDYGDPVEIYPGEVPVFWACGVTAQRAVAGAKIPFGIGHKPGHMLITDQLNSQLAVL